MARFMMPSSCLIGTPCFLESFVEHVDRLARHWMEARTSNTLCKVQHRSILKVKRRGESRRISRMRDVTQRCRCQNFYYFSLHLALWFGSICCALKKPLHNASLDYLPRRHIWLDRRPAVQKYFGSRESIENRVETYETVYRGIDRAYNFADCFMGAISESSWRWQNIHTARQIAPRSRCTSSDGAQSCLRYSSMDGKNQKESKRFLLWRANSKRRRGRLL